MASGFPVLIAEDNEDDAFVIKRAFNSNGVSGIHIAEDGVQAIDYLSGQGIYKDRSTFVIPKLILLDLKMPRVSGFQVLEWVQSQPEFSVIPTIVWSASADPTDVKQAYCLGANAYICKASSYPKMVTTVGRLIHFWDECLIPLPGQNLPSCLDLRKRNPFS